MYMYIIINGVAGGRAVLALQVVYFFSFVGDQTQTSADDLIINQLQAIFQLFSSYLPTGEFCQVSKLNIQAKKMAALK